jgi:hypothetical protein
MKRPRYRLQLEELESRTLLTGASVTASALAGTAGGTYALGPSLPTTGSTYELAGTGTVGPLGKVAVGGFLQAARYISPGHAGGVVTLSSARGTAALQLSGTSAGSSRLPAQFSFLLVSGTGAYSHLNQGGTLLLKLTATGHTAGTFTFTIPAGTSTKLPPTGGGSGGTGKPPPQQNALGGTATGTYALGPSLPTTGATYELDGTGTVGPLGKVTVSGFLQAAGYVSPGHAGGVVTLSSAQGTAALQLSGTSAGSSRLPAQFSFLLVSATGVYSHLSQGGTIGLTLAARGPMGGSFAFTIPAGTSAKPPPTGTGSGTGTPPSQQNTLGGTITGTYAVGPSLATTGRTFQLTGAGNVAPLGQVAAGALLQAAGFVSPGHAGGLVTLSNAQGTVQLQPIGASQPGGVSMPGRLTFQVVWGTGAYARLSRGGTADLTLTARGHTGGSFTLTFGP